MQRTTVVLTALALIVACAPGFAAVEWAGDPVIHLDANDLTPGTTGADLVWTNKAPPGGTFAPDPLREVQPIVKQGALGQSGVTKNYVEFTRSTIAPAAGGYGDPASYLLWSQFAPATISQGSSFSVEAWVYLTTVDELQTYFSIARREGNEPLLDPHDATSPNNFACSAGYAPAGSTAPYRAVGMATANLLWVNAPQLAHSYNYFAATYDSATLTVSVYANGELNNSLTLGSALNIAADQPVYLGAMWFSANANSKYLQQGLKNGGIAVLRVHDGVLTPAQIQNNFDAEQADYIAYRPIFSQDTALAVTVGAGSPSTAARKALIAPVFLTPPSTDITWSLSGAVPAGFAIDPATGTITIARTVAPGSYDVTAVATNTHGTDSLPLTFTVTAEFYGLWVTTYNETQGPAFLNPISNLMAVVPSGKTLQTADITYPADFAFSTAFPGITNDDTIALLWQGWFDVSIEGHGDYTFGTQSDDGSVIYLDLNNDGDFADVGELVLDSNIDQPPAIKTANVTLNMDSVRIAIGFYENGGGQAMTARFGVGADVAWEELVPIGGTSGHFMADPPKVPTGLGATPGDATVSLNWDDSTAPDFASYNVYRSTTAGSGYGAALARGLTTSEYTDNTVTNGVAYFYVVTTVNSLGYESKLSLEVTATPLPPPAAPTGLAATPGDATVALDWADNTEAYFASYNVYRSTTSGSYDAALATGLTTSAYTDNTVTNGVAYFYVVTAVNSLGDESAVSAEVTATPKANDIYVFMGNTNGDAKVDIADAIALLGYLFAKKAAPSCAKGADTNDDDKIDIADAVNILSYLFAKGSMKAPDGSVVSATGGTPAACAPYAADGTDGNGKPNFPSTVGTLPACETPCQ